MHIALTESLEKYVRDLIAAGTYADASDVVRDALRLKMKLEAEDRAKLESLRHDIDIGWRQADEGRFATFDLEVMTRELDTELGPRPRG
jgi:antitoxin ParD1/3/4